MIIEDSVLAALLVAWQAAVARRDAAGSLFPTVPVLRATFNRAVAALADHTWETRGCVSFGTAFVTAGLLART